MNFRVNFEVHSGYGGPFLLVNAPGSVHFLGIKILNFNIFWGFHNNEYFFGVMKILWVFFGGHHKIGLV